MPELNKEQVKIVKDIIYKKISNEKNKSLNLTTTQRLELEEKINQNSTLKSLVSKIKEMTNKLSQISLKKYGVTTYIDNYSYNGNYGNGPKTTYLRVNQQPGIEEKNQTKRKKLEELQDILMLEMAGTENQIDINKTIESIDKRIADAIKSIK